MEIITITPVEKIIQFKGPVIKLKALNEEYMAKLEAETLEKLNKEYREVTVIYAEEVLKFSDNVDLSHIVFDTNFAF
jgi:hypothetical protein